MIELNKIELNKVRLNRLFLNTLYAGQKRSAGGDGFPRLPGDVTRWSFKGLTNEMMAKNPRLEDVDGKGRFLTFKNFLWGGMSGCGGYSLSKETFSYTPDIYSFNFTDPGGGLKIFDVYFQLIGLEENSGVTFNLDVRESGTAKRIKRETYTKDGIYHFEYKSEDDATNLYMVGYNGDGTGRATFTVKILPYYAGALVFDGVDDYGICENFPILTKEKGYTVVALRKWLTPEDKANNEVLIANLKGEVWNAPNLGAFGCEIKYNNSDPKVVRASSFGQESKININENDLLFYQTSNSYNGVNLASGIGNSLGGSFLIVGSGGKTSLRANAAIWELIILDHDATEEELTKIKNYFIKTYPWLFFDQAWTVVGKSNEDTDRATIANITGNGNNLVLSNFGFAGNSGYGEYAYNWNEWGIDNGAATNISKQYNKFVAVMPVNQSISTCSLYSPEVPIGTRYQFKLKITGLTTDYTVRVMEGYTGDSNIIYEFDKDGTYQIDHTMTGSGNQLRLYIRMYCAVPNAEGTTVTVEQIPEYEGYLVTDGVDDKVRSSLFTLNKDWTIVGNWTMLSNIPSNCGIIKVSSMFLYNSLDGVTIYFAGGPIEIQSKSINAFCSDGRIYLNDWTEILKPDVQTALGGSKSGLNIASYSANFTKMAFKNLAIYDGKNLSKDDCIKAYNYLQTLKAK